MNSRTAQVALVAACVVLIFAALALSKSGQAQPGGEAIRIHLFQPQWSSATLRYRRHENHAEFQTLTMAEDHRDDWWVTSVDAAVIEFYFEGETGRIDLGGTNGCYPDDHFACDDKSVRAENFRNSAREIWVKNGLVFVSDPAQPPANDEFTILSLNLHTYQEFDTGGVDERDLTRTMATGRIANHGPIFDRIARAIIELDADVVCLQEVGEWSEGPTISSAFGESESNAVQQILMRLGDRQYNYVADWSHFGWEVWREGSAILSQHPLVETGSRFITSPESAIRRTWKSRNVPMAKIDVPGVGEIAVFSVHAGWWDDEEEPFQTQFRRLTNWAEEIRTPDISVILCGDFNQPAGSATQQFMTNDSGFSDQYALANPEGLLDATVDGDIDGWDADRNGMRLDYILMDDDSALRTVAAQRVFTQNVFGRVSDHTGIYAHFARREIDAEEPFDTSSTPLYLAGSHSGGRAVVGQRFEATEDGTLRLTTMLGAAIDLPDSGLRPHRFFISDRSGTRRQIGSIGKGGMEVRLGTTLPLAEGREPFVLSVTTPGLFQFDLNLQDQTLVIRRL